MKKYLCALTIIIISATTFAGCKVFWPQVFPPEEILPIIFLTGDIEDTVYVDMGTLTSRQFGQDEGYALSDVLGKAVMLSTEYDILAIARNDKAVKLEQDTIDACYIVMTKEGVLELRSSVHYYFVNCFLPLRSVSEIVVLASEETGRGIEVQGGKTPKLYVKKQIEFVFAQLRTYVSNNGNTVVEYRRDATYADIILSGGYTGATITLADSTEVEIDSTTKEIIDWRNGNLILRSSVSPIISIELRGGTQEQGT